MSNEIFGEYVKIQKKIDELDAIKVALREKILKEVSKNPEKKEVTEWGNFTVAATTKWEYSEAVKKLEDKVKISKEKEQKKGIAKASVSESLRFIPKKAEA